MRATPYLLDGNTCKYQLYFVQISETWLLFRNTQRVWTKQLKNKKPPTKSCTNHLRCRSRGGVATPRWTVFQCSDSQQRNVLFFWVTLQKKKKKKKQKWTLAGCSWRCNQREEQHNLLRCDSRRVCLSSASPGDWGEERGGCYYLVVTAAHSASSRPSRCCARFSPRHWWNGAATPPPSPPTPSPPPDLHSNRAW